VTTIVYLHGFRSSPASIKATQLHDHVALLANSVKPRLHIPELTDRPAAAVAEVAAWVEREADAKALTFIGSSLGGYYATHLAERFGARAVLVNPTVRPYADLQPWRGVQTNLHTGAAFEVTQAHFDELIGLRVARITRAERYWLLVETGDEVLDYREAVAFYGGAFQYVRGGGDHTFTELGMQLPAILRFAGVGPARMEHPPTLAPLAAPQGADQSVGAALPD